jgi:RNA polymerase primary sigma factor
VTDQARAEFPPDLSPAVRAAWLDLSAALAAGDATKDHIVRVIFEHGLTDQDVDQLATLLRAPTPSAPEALETGATNHTSAPPAAFDDSYWSESPAEPADAAGDDPLLAACLTDLLADWERRGRTLGHSDFMRIADRRGLSPEQQLALLALLRERSIVLEEPESDVEDEDPRQQRSGDSKSVDLLGTYLRQIGQHRLLRAEEEVELGRLIAAGRQAEQLLQDESRAARLTRRELQTTYETVRRGRTAFDALVTANLRLAVSVARHFGGFGGLELEDRIQAANLGLIRAAEKFDHTLGYKFSTYATWWIRQSIDRWSADTGRLIRLPVHFVELSRKVRRERARLTEKLNREPSLTELAKHLHMDPHKVQFALDASEGVLSLDATLSSTDDFTLADLLASRDGGMSTDPANIVPQQVMDQELQRVVRSALPPRDADVIVRRFGLNGEEPQTLEEIGVTYGLTRERIRQIEAKWLERLARNPDVRRIRGVYQAPRSSDMRSDASVGLAIKQYAKRQRATRSAELTEGSRA